MKPVYIDFLNALDIAQLALSPDETILFWHRGLSLSDIALGHALLAKSKALGIGQRLRFR